MTLRGYPFLLDGPTLYRDIFGIHRHTFYSRKKAGAYDDMEWVNDGGDPKVTRPSLERWLKKHMVAPND